MNTTPALTLYHYWRSSCSWRVRWALAVKGVPYTSVPVNLLTNEQKSEAYLRVNPMGQVPTLVVDGAPLSDSMALLEFIEESWPTPALLPGDPLGRARVRRLSQLITSGIQPLQNLGVMRHLSDDPAVQKAWCRHWIERGMDAWEAAAAPLAGLYCHGDHLSFADLCLIPQMYNAERFSLDLSRWPTAEAIYRRCLVLPSCEEAAPHNQPGATP